MSVKQLVQNQTSAIDGYGKRNLLHLSKLLIKKTIFRNNFQNRSLLSFGPFPSIWLSILVILRREKQPALIFVFYERQHLSSKLAGI